MNDPLPSPGGESGALPTMLTVHHPTMVLFVDRSSQQWIVRDAEGRFWALSHSGDCWKNRQPFEPTEETELEMVPGHYKYFLGVPF